MKYYTILEQHNDGSWWHHGKTFATWGEAFDFQRKWIWWDEKRNKQIIGHDEVLPDRTLVTHDFNKYYDIGNDCPGAEAAVIKAELL